MRVVLDEADVFPRVLKRYFMVKHSADPRWGKRRFWKKLSRVEILETIRVQRKRVKAHRFANVVVLTDEKGDFRKHWRHFMVLFPFLRWEKNHWKAYKKVSFFQIKMRYVEWLKRFENAYLLAF